MLRQYLDGDVRVLVIDHNLNYGAGTVRIEWGHKWAVYYPLPGDTETQLLIELCAWGEAPLSILADRIDDIEPAERGGQFGDFTTTLRMPGMTTWGTVGERWRK